MAKYSKEKTEECAGWVRENGLIEYGGARLKDFCAFFRIDTQTYYRWMQNADFAEAIKNAREDFKKKLSRDIAVSLAKAATGYQYEQVETVAVPDVDGNPVVRQQRRIKKDVQPNVAAAIFLLTNIDPEHYQNRQTQDIRASIGRQNDPEGKFAGLPEDVLFDIADKLQAEEYKLALKEKGEHATGWN